MDDLLTLVMFTPEEISWLNNVLGAYEAEFGLPPESEFPEHYSIIQKLGLDD